MLRFLSRELLHTGPPRCSATAGLPRRCFRIPPLAAPLSHSPDATAAVVSGVGDSRRSLTVSYLIGSCGLSPESALSASKKVRFRTTDNADSVLGLLRDSGCSPSQVATIVSKHPVLLRMHAANNLKPKLECLRGAGISGPRLVELLCTNPKIFCNSLERKIAPLLELLQRTLPPGFPVIEALGIATSPRPEDQLSEINTLRRHGVPDSGILKLLSGRRLARVSSPSWFGETVAAVRAMGLDPADPTFPYAVRVMAYMCKETWDRKLVLYRSLGWSDGEIISAFVKQPVILGMSDKAIQQKMEFFMGKLGMTPVWLSRNPVLLKLSFVNRIAPRCAVLKVLIDRGVLPVRKMGMVTLLMLPGKRFQERFVDKYLEKAPDVLDAHLGKVEFSWFGTPARMVGTCLCW